MSGELLLKITALQKEIEAKESQWDLNAKHGVKDWALLDEINDMKKELENLESSCNLDGDCVSCGS